MTVRGAKASDLPRAAEILEKSFTGSYRYWSLRLLNVLEVIVAELEGEIVGVAELYVTEAKGYGRIGVISFIAVDERYRGRGIGRQLVLFAEQLFRSRKCRYAAASTRSSNAASIKLFTSLGYKLHERGDPVFEELEYPLYAYEDDVVMLKRISG